MIRKFALLVLAAFPVLTLAAEAPSMDALKSRLLEKFPNVQIAAVQPSPQIPGWYEVVTAEQLVYTNTDASLLFAGSVIETDTRADLTKRRWADLHRIDFESLPFNLAVKVTKGKGTRRIAVFTDPLCPFCQELEKNLVGIDDVTVYNFLFPLESLHPGATLKARQIWCAADRSRAWTAWMISRTEPAGPASCDTQGLITVESLGKQLKVAATPTVFLSDGRRIDGVEPAAALEKDMAAALNAPLRH